MSTKPLRLLLLAAAMSGLLLAAACPKQDTEVAAAPPAGEGGLITVTEVSVPEDNQVFINGNNVIEGFPCFLTDPLRVVVDIRNADAAPAVPSEVTGRGMIFKVEIQTISTVNPQVVRVTIYVADDVTYELKPRGNTGTLVVLKPRKKKPAAEQPAAAPAPSYEEARRDAERLISGETPRTASAMSPPTSSQPRPAVAGASSSPLLPDLPPANPDGSATVVGEIFYRTFGAGIQIMIYTNGTLKDFKNYESGNALIIDLPGISPATPKRDYPISWAGVSVVRVGGDSSRTRVTVNFSRKRPYQITQTSTGLVITVMP